MTAGLNIGDAGCGNVSGPGLNLNREVPIGKNTGLSLRQKI
jgi:hypothetical protein